MVDVREQGTSVHFRDFLIHGRRSSSGLEKVAQLYVRRTISLRQAQGRETERTQARYESLQIIIAANFANF
jgi:hypothetical protein